MKKIYLLSFLALTACGGPRLPKQFDVNEVAWSKIPSSSKLIVRGYTINRYGNEKRCDSGGATYATLYPQSSYFDQWWKIETSGWHFTDTPSKLAQSYMKKAPLQRFCQFEFDNVAPGKWYLEMNMGYYSFSMYETYGSREEKTFKPRYGDLNDHYVHVPIIIDTTDEIKKTMIVYYPHKKGSPVEQLEWVEPHKDKKKDTNGMFEGN